MFICISVYMSACVFPCACVSLWVIVGDVYVCVTMHLRIHLCVSACVHVQMWSITWADPQRERITGPCVHSSLRLDQWYSVECFLVVGFVHTTKITIFPFPCICREKRRTYLWRTVTTALLESLCLCLSPHQGPNKVSMYRCRNQG